MPKYLTELAPWERKREYYNNIQLGKDVKTQTETINNQTKAMIATQIASTNAIIASQERVAEGIDKVAYGIEQVKEGMYGLQAAFEFGISEVVWQIEQNRHVLKSILEILSAPLDTQAKELRKRAEEAYANGWFEDALEDFLESEKKNRYDFSIHISIGMIYLFQKVDKEKSLKYFDKAIKYSLPKSHYHTSFSLLYKALIKRDAGLIEEAEKYTDEAVALSPDFAEVLYQNAQYNALLNKPEKVVSLLKKVIELDVNYCEKTINESDFRKIKSNVDYLFRELRDKQGKNARNRYAVISKKIDALNNLIHEISQQETIEVHDKEMKAVQKRIVELMQRNSYRDYLEANALINKLSMLFEKLNTDIKSQINKKIRGYESRIYNIKASHDKYDYGGIIGTIIVLGVVLCIAVDITFFSSIIIIGVIFLIYFVILMTGDASAIKESKIAIERLNGFISKL